MDVPNFARVVSTDSGQHVGDVGRKADIGARFLMGLKLENWLAVIAGIKSIDQA